MLPNGGYVITWRENEKITFQLFDGKGDKVGGPKSVPAGQTQQFADVHAVGPNGDFVITWTENTGVSAAARNLKSQKYSVDGNPIGPVVTTPTSTDVRDDAQVTANASGGWTATYVEKIGNDIFVKLINYNSSGETTGPVDVFTGTTPTLPDVAWIGGVMHATAFVYENSSTVGIRVVNGNGTSNLLQIDDAIEAKVTALKGPDGLPSGKFVVVTNDGNGPTSKIEARLYEYNSVSNTLSASGAPLEISTGQKDTEGTKVSVTALQDGGFAVAYVASTNGDNADIWVKVVDAEGNTGNPIKIHNDAGVQVTPTISEMADGRLAVSWYNKSSGYGAISTTIVDARSGDVTVKGTTGNDIYAPSVHAGDDFDGREGIDTLTFQAAGSGVGVHLGENRGTAGIAAGDKYTNFENIIGSNFADTLVGSAVSNTINGGAGNDVIDGAGGNDEMNGGTGADIYYVDDTADRINESAAADIDTVYTSATYTLSAYIENLFATGTGAINLTGNDWNNTIVGNEAANGINGGNGNDVLHGAGGNDVINAGAGNDVLEGGTGADILSGGDGIDALNGGDDNDTLSGGEGADNLNGGNGNDSLDGGNGDDVMQGGGGADVMNGGAGNDTYYIDDVNDQVVDGAGVDTVYLGVSYDVSRLGTIENITGIGAVDITLTGNAFNNVLTGNDGANILIGGAGNDVLYGGAGNDRIHGQEGNDILAGGAGRDLFVFDKAPHKSRNLDKITDYNVRDDSIYVENKYFKVGSGSLNKPKKMESKYFFKGTKAHDRDDRLIYDQKKGVLYYDPDGTGSKAQIKVATFDKKPALNINEFFVI
jgi:Ca2+-binding RTX toxin-like protein